jgi:hypothetical protein
VIGSDAGPFTDPDGFAWEAPVNERASDAGRERPAVTVSDPRATPSG